jgi:hypothetical protein
VNDRLTKVPGYPDRRQILAGMAYFPGTGPAGKTCGDCQHRGYRRKTERSTGTFYNCYACSQFKRLTGNHGPTVKAWWPSCKYFRAKE